jgi:hypothetical protein
LYHFFDWKGVSEKLLDAVSRNRGIEQLELRYRSYVDEDAMCDHSSWVLKIFPFLRRIFNGDSCIKSLKLSFALRFYDPTKRKRFLTKTGQVLIRAIEEAQARGSGTEGTEWTLSFLNVSVEDSSGRRCYGEYSFLPHSGVHMNHVEAWDRVVTPVLVLNCYRQSMRKPFRGGLFPLAVQAINWGSVYRKTTHHVPVVLSIGNAGLIYHMLRSGLRGNAK